MSCLRRDAVEEARSHCSHEASRLQRRSIKKMRRVESSRVGKLLLLLLLKLKLQLELMLLLKLLCVAQMHVVILIQ